MNGEVEDAITYADGVDPHVRDRLVGVKNGCTCRACSDVRKVSKTLRGGYSYIQAWESIICFMKDMVVCEDWYMARRLLGFNIISRQNKPNSVLYLARLCNKFGVADDIMGVILSFLSEKWEFWMVNLKYDNIRVVDLIDFEKNRLPRDHGVF